MKPKTIQARMDYSASYSGGVDIAVAALRRFWGWNITADTFSGSSSDVYDKLYEILTVLPEPTNTGFTKDE